MFKFLSITILSFGFGLFGLGQAFAQTSTKARATKPAAAKPAPRPAAKPKQPKLQPLQADGVIRIENEKPVKPSISEKAEDVSNKIPKNFVEQMLSDGTWIDAVENAGTPANLEMQGLISAFTSGMASNSIAALVLRDDQTYKLKIQLIHYFEAADQRELVPYRLNRNRLAEIKAHITQKYLGAIFTLIQSSTIRDYEPIMMEVRTQLERNILRVVDLTPELRRQLNEERTQVKVHQYENFGLEEKRNGKYLINGLYIEAKKTLAFDLNRSKYENLVTIAHEIIHAADPELIQQREKLKSLYSKVIEKLQPHVPRLDAENFVKALIQDTFYEMGRIDIAHSMQRLREEYVQKLKVNLDKKPLEVLSKDQDFKDFMRTLISVTVENEYKAYTLSYALYQNLKSDKILPPLLSRNDFMQAQFKHEHSLPFTLSVAMNPFAKNTHMGQLNLQSTPELAATIVQIKTIFEINYLEQSKVMMTEVGVKYARLFEMIRRHNDMMSDESVPAWTKPGNFDSPTNPFQTLEAKVSTAWIIRFKLNLQSFLKKIVGLQESLLSMRAGMMDLHDVTFGELKLLGMQPETIRNEQGQWVENQGQFLPSTLDASCRADVLNQIQNGADNSQAEEYLSYFRELRWSPETTSDRTPVDQDAVMLNLYRLNLLKAVRWLRLELPQSHENIAGIKTILAKIHTGNYDTNEITPERAKEMTEDLRAYLKAAAVSGDEFRNVEALMIAISQMYYMALESKWQPVHEEFETRMRSAKRFLDDIGYNPQTTYEQIITKMNSDVSQFRNQVRTEFKACASTNIDFYSRLTKMVLGRFQFPVTGICYNRELYIFRQTCDYNRSASTSVPQGRPQSKIFIGGREIKLKPFDTFK